MLPSSQSVWAVVCARGVFFVHLGGREDHETGSGGGAVPRVLALFKAKLLPVCGGIFSARMDLPSDLES